MLLLIVATGFILGWRYFQPMEENSAVAVTELKKIASATDETSATLKTMAADVKRIADATEKCCADKKVAPAPAKKVKKKKACATLASPKVKQAEEKPAAPLATAPPKEEKKPEPKVEAKKCSGADLQLLEDGRIICAPSSVTPTPAPVLPKVAEIKCVAPNIRQLMDDGSIACVQPPAIPVVQAPAPPAPVADVCTSLGLTGSNFVPAVDERGVAYCAEEVKSSKVLAVVQYVTCTTVGAVAGYQRGGPNGAAIGATGSAALTYAGRSYGEGWGWVGCVPGAGVLGYDAIKAATRTKTKTITINTSGGTTGGGTISGATTGGGTIQ